jgi:hypothetical protein
MPMKPAFDPSDVAYNVATMTVVSGSIVGKQTIAPTAAPTAHPTEEGYTVVEQQQQAVVVAAAFSFPLSQEEAFDPVMRVSLEQGCAASLGVEPTMVRVAEINGQQVVRARGRSRRRMQSWVREKVVFIRVLESSTQITFEVEAASAAASTVAALKEHLVQAATEGSIVANVQKSASDNGVLTPALAEMTRALDTPTVAEVAREVTVVVAVRPTGKPSTAPTSAPTAEGGAIEGLDAKTRLDEVSHAHQQYDVPCVRNMLCVVVLTALWLLPY